MTRALRVTVVYAEAGRAIEIPMRLAAGATVADAIDDAVRAGLDAALIRNAPVGIYGKRCQRDTPLEDGDRVEIYRRLIADPKHVRRRRAALARYRDGKP